MIAELGTRNSELLRLAARLPVRRARMVVGMVCRASVPDAEPSHRDGLQQRAAAAFEKDLQPVRMAIVSALHAESREALEGLRHLLPGLLREINRAPAFADSLLRAMAEEFFGTFAGEIEHGPLLSANASFDESPVVTESLRRWRLREIWPTEFSSADLRRFSSELHLRSITSARTTNALYVQEIDDTVAEMLAGRINRATGVLRLMRRLKELGYDPATGFPQDMAKVPPAERDSLQDLSSERRIRLVLDTNVAIARNAARVISGNTDQARFLYPAWELVRLAWREVPRGTPESHSIGWQRRWTDAFAAVDGEGAIEGKLIALKDSPIWQALADGAGGYTDTLGHPFPPFAFNSGMDWRAVPRRECLAIDLISGDAAPAPVPVSLAPLAGEIQAALRKLGPDFKTELLRELREEGRTP